jgi:erythronate-4-phosphate dehydrogenase
MIATALARFLGVAEPAPDPFRPPLDAPEIEVSAQGRGAVREAVRHVYDVRADDRRLRAALDAAGRSPDARAAAFDRLRRDYPVRREFAGHRVRGAAGDEERRTLAALGFAPD